MALFLIAIAFPAAAADDEFYGTYKLVSSSRTVLATGQVETYTGERGYITYGKDGRMMVLIVRGDRPKAESFEKMTDQQRADLFRSMTAYTGTYTFDGKTMQHHIDIAGNEIWSGTTQSRDVRKDGERLVYTTRPAPTPRDGKLSITTLTWEKLK
jgi:hypothetical protein